MLDIIPHSIQKIHNSAFLRRLISLYVQVPSFPEHQPKILDFKQEGPHQTHYSIIHLAPVQVKLETHPIKVHPQRHHQEPLPIKDLPSKTVHPQHLH